MAKYTEKKETFVFRKVLGFFGNMVQNYDGMCADDDFFDVLDANFDHDDAVELIMAAYTPQELKDMQNAKSRRARLDLSDDLDEVFCALWNNEGGRGKCRAVIEAAIDYMRGNCGESESDAMESRLSCLKDTLKLDDLEAELLMLAYVKAETGFDWPCRVDIRNLPKFYAMALDRSVEEVRCALAPQGKLMKFSLLDDDFDFSSRTLGSFMAGSSDQAINRRFYDMDANESPLPWDYYGELAKGDGEVLKRMVASCDGKCNILLYGAPGTGKTSFAKSLAKELGRTVFQIRQGDEDGNNMKPQTRMIGIQICNAQESRDTGIMVIDEADELLRTTTGGGLFGMMGGKGGGKAGRTEKGVVNTLLDDMRMPTIWVANTSPDEMDESVRRRFDYSVRFDRLNVRQREMIWRNQVAKHGLEPLVPPQKSDEFAAKYETDAGGISGVLANVKRMARSSDEVDSLVDTLMGPYCKLMGLKHGGGFLPAKDYSLDGLSIKGSVKLDKIVKAARNFVDARFNSDAEDRPRLNILLFGPPGTGKTEFVKYLGKTLGRKVEALKGSDLLSCFVGGTEKRIAEAFRQAKADGSILFLDEIDGLLQDRAGASHSWELTQVNELLQQMESFDGIMVAATNFAKNLDPATMRRFTYKIEFGYLDEDGKRRFFERFFKTSLADGEIEALSALKNLAPGDFRTVRQQMFYLGDEVTNMDRIEALKDECSRKKEEKPQRHVGFGN